MSEGSFSENLTYLNARSSRIEAIAAELGEVEGPKFLDALTNPKIKVMRIHKALKAVGITVSHSTLGQWRANHQ